MRTAAALLLFGAMVLAQDKHPPTLAPTLKVEPWTAHASKTQDGLRYVWWIPKGLKAGQKRPLVVILHGTGLDYRWGLWNNKPGVFRPDDFVVSLDGTSPGQGESRLFLGEPKDAKSFKAFLDEMRKALPIDQVLLYGHSQGGFFVVYYAGEFPDTVDGVVAHASGAWNWSKTGPRTKKVAIAFQHGTLDPVVPYGQSPGARDHYMGLGFPLLHLRRLPRYNHWPNAVRSNESLGWARGMSTSDPELALEEAVEILRPKPPDEYQWETVVGFSAARDILRRFESSSGFPKPPESGLAAKAKALAARVDAHAAQHVAALKKSVSKRADLKLDDRPWLGHLVSLREDFRGVPPVEDYLKSIAFDSVHESHQKSSKAFFDAYYKDGKPGDVARNVLSALSDCFLLESLPHDLAERGQTWTKDKKDLGFTKKDEALLANFESWQSGWKDGLHAYEKLWKAWRP